MSSQVNRTPKYSVCITTKNNVSTIRSSLDALLSMIDPSDWEVVVVDGESTDGQIPVLRDYEARGLLKLIVQKSNRGEGRQLAFLNSSGDYVVSMVDTDDVLGPGFRPLIQRYHSEFEGSMLLAGIMISPRTLLTELGGWNKEFHGEDFVLWERAKKVGRFVAIDPPGDLFARKVRHKRGPLDKTRTLWAYIEQDRRPKVSWKTWPVYQGLRLIHWFKVKATGKPGRQTS
jgi:glycosyltransferase involved in cell wall biosynthesis